MTWFGNRGEEQDLTTAEGQGERVLRVLAADEDAAALERTASVLRELGHDVVGCVVALAETAQTIAAEDPDISVVVLHDDDDHALELIEEITEFASGPVVALLDRDDPDFVRKAADSGIYAYARSGRPQDLQGAIDVALRRFEETLALAEEVGQLESALQRRSVIERAKGILMERHGLAERAAFEQLRSHARSSRRTVVDVARDLAGGATPAPPGD